MEGYRTRQRTLKRKKRKKLVKLAVAPSLLILLALIIFLISRLSGGPDSGKTELSNKADTSVKEKKQPAKTKSVRPAKKAQAKQVKSENKKGTELIGLLVGGNKKVEDSVYHAILVLNNNTKKALIVSIPDDTVLKISAQSFDKIKTAVREGGPEAYLSAVKNLGIDVKYFIQADADFGDVTPGNLSDIFLKAKSSNISSENILAYSKLIKQFDVSKSYLPVKEIRASGETLSQPIADDLNKLLQGQSLEVKKANRPTVLILNGNGIPGIGSLMAVKLIKSGYVVTDTRNAKDADGKDDFTKPKTLIYSSLDDEELLKDIISLIGVGEVAEGNSQKTAQVTIVLGKDFKKAE